MCDPFPGLHFIIKILTLYKRKGTGDAHFLFLIRIIDVF